MEEVLGIKLSDAPIQSILKSGEILCDLVNKIKPGSVPKVNKATMAFKQMENINNFLSAIAKLGVSQTDTFMTVDLYEDKNMNQVIQSLHALGRISRTVPGYTGPSIGPKIADKHEVTFTEEQLRKGQNSLTFTQVNQAETQKIVEDAKRGNDSVVRSKQSGTAMASLGKLDAGKADAQKDANAARRQGHNIIK